MIGAQPAFVVRLPGASPSKLASVFLIRIIMDIRHQEETKRNKFHYYDHLRDVMKKMVVSLHLSL